MAGMKTIMVLSLFLALGILLVILSCAIYDNWWPLFVVLLYLLAPFPNLIQSHTKSDFSSTSFDMNDSPKSGSELSFFVTSLLITSGFGLPFVLAHTNVITWTAMELSFVGGVLIYGTILGYTTHFMESPEESSW